MVTLRRAFNQIISNMAMDQSIYSVYREPSTPLNIDIRKSVKKCTIKKRSVYVISFSFAILVIVGVSVALGNSNRSDNLLMISRGEWIAQPPSQPIDDVELPVSIVIIIHTATENCTYKKECIYHVRKIQAFHMESRDWYDIGYNFLVGGDGAAYVGRGWNKKGVHTPAYNTQSIGLAFIGTFNTSLPPERQLLAARKLIQEGIKIGKISKHYKLYGHRDLMQTFSPGDMLYNEIKSWPHFSEDKPEKLHLLSRREWMARPSSGPMINLENPIKYVVICHTATNYCTNETSCNFLVRTMQIFHMEAKHWSDIAYNFLVGGDGSIYEGRGWNKAGAHTRYYNTQSIGLAFIGTFNDHLPPERQLYAAKKLIQEGIEIGKISKDYKLYGHRDLMQTLSPGDMLYNEIKSWPHFADKQHNICQSVSQVSREEWMAQSSSVPINVLSHPVPNVIIIHTVTKNCTNKMSCISIVRTIQTYHMESRKWSDISYNFLVGGDGSIYEGRGWDKVGAHTKDYNTQSIGLAFIGTFNDNLPPERQLLAAKQLIQEGIEMGKISKHYKLYGHRDLMQTLSPGDVLYNEIQSWPHFAGHQHIISRDGWLARPSSNPIDALAHPVPNLIIIHTETNKCTNKMACTSILMSIQTHHMESRKWSDIGYNFLVGGDGSIYEGRGWDKVGAHTKGYNAQSIGLAFIGTFNDYLPPEKQLLAAKQLIQEGITLGKISEDFKLYGHRQLTPTSSPGNSLFAEIKSWPHFANDSI